jgi:hypothetical protein
MDTQNKTLSLPKELIYRAKRTFYNATNLI